MYYEDANIRKEFGGKNFKCVYLRHHIWCADFYPTRAENVDILTDSQFL